MRLAHFDYTQPGAYFVTICAAERACLFGEVADCVMLISGAGEVVADVWRTLPPRFPEITLDSFVVMPNHIHGVICISATMKRGLPAVVQAFKSLSARRIAARGRSTSPIWQRGYYEHVVRNDADLDRVRRYIEENPIRWDLDEENPMRRVSP
jgi:putative transposase